MKFWNTEPVEPGRLWRGGSEKVASVASVVGSNMYSSGPASPTQTDTSRPRESKVIEPQS